MVLDAFQFPINYPKALAASDVYRSWVQIFVWRAWLKLEEVDPSDIFLWPQYSATMTIVYSLITYHPVTVPPHDCSVPDPRSELWWRHTPFSGWCHNLDNSQSVTTVFFPLGSYYHTHKHLRRPVIPSWVTSIPCASSHQGSSVFC
jgi:hypothetical protein